jgi:hypothetical protein
MMKNRIIKDLHYIRGCTLGVQQQFIIAHLLDACFPLQRLGTLLHPGKHLLVLLVGLECVEDVGLLAEEAVDGGLVAVGLWLNETHLFGSITLFIIIHPQNLSPLIFTSELVSPLSTPPYPQPLQAGRPSRTSRFLKTPSS